MAYGTVVKIGYFLSCEEYGPRRAGRPGAAAEAAGFEALWISDHYHPWNDEQGHSPFVWSVIGALSEGRPARHHRRDLSDGAHPPGDHGPGRGDRGRDAEGRFVLGVGTGEALNEHMLGDPWPSADVRLEMLEEAVAVMRELWAGGS